MEIPREGEIPQVESIANFEDKSSLNIPSGQQRGRARWLPGSIISAVFALSLLTTAIGPVSANNGVAQEFAKPTPKAGSLASKTSETPRKPEVALEQGSNIVADQMQVSADGTVTAALFLARDGKYHLGVADKDVTFTDLKEFSFNALTLALDRTDPRRITVAGVLPDKNIGVLHYTEDGGQTWTELQGDKMDQAAIEATGGLKGAIRWAGYDSDGNLHFTEINNNPGDKTIYAPLLQKGQSKIIHRPVEFESGASSSEPFDHVFGLSSLEKTGVKTYASNGYLYSTGHLVGILLRPDKVTIKNEASFSPDVIVTFMNGSTVMTWTANNGIPVEIPNSEDAIVAGIRILQDNQFKPEKSFLIPYNLFPDDRGRRSFSVSALAKNPDEDVMEAAVTVNKRDNRFFTKVLRIANASGNPGADQRNFSTSNITGDWPAEGAVNPLGGLKIFINNKGEKVRRLAFITTRDGQNGQVMDVINGNATRTGYMGPRAVQPAPTPVIISTIIDGKKVLIPLVQKSPGRS